MPKCEIFSLIDSREFYIIAPPWVGDFGTVIKSLKLFRFCHDVEVFFREDFVLVHAEHALKKIFIARSKIKKVFYGCFGTHLQVSKTIF